MIVKLNINEHWISEGTNGHRVMTLEEFMEYQCEVCLEKLADFEIHFDTCPQEESISVCRDCGKAITLSLMDNEDFYENIHLYKY